MKSVSVLLVWLFLLSSFLSASSPTEEPEEDTVIHELEPFEILPDPKPPKYLDQTLEQYGLSKIETENGIRFLWIRSFQEPLLFEAFDDRETVSLVAKRYDGDKEMWIYWRSISVTRKEHLSVLESVKKDFGFYEIPFSIERSGYDGSEWFIEANIEGKHHSVYRWSPEADTLIYKLGFMFISAFIEPPLSPIY